MYHSITAIDVNERAIIGDDSDNHLDFRNVTFADELQEIRAGHGDDQVQGSEGN